LDSILEKLERSKEPRAPRHKRRLSDLILIAFHHACDLPDVEAASELLHILDFMTIRHPSLPTGRERRVQEGLVAAHERLWQIRHSTPSIASIDGFNGV
jgi:hypothetical protein